MNVKHAFGGLMLVCVMFVLVHHYLVSHRHRLELFNVTLWARGRGSGEKSERRVSIGAGLAMDGSTNGTKPLQILYWTDFYSDPNWFGMGTAPFQDCAIPKYRAGCTATSDRSALPNAAAILVHMRNINSPRNLPDLKTRDPEQKWIMYMRESPSYGFINYTPFNRIFNASMTYKKASDVYLPSIKFKRRGGGRNGKDGGTVTPINYAAGKTRIVAWFVSNCRTASVREQYVAELKHYIDIDIYGKCGNLSCPKEPGKSYAEQCNKLLQKQYKFYLSFENSICKEYFSEKVAKTYHLDVVPVVLGGAKYVQLFPPNSYINVRNFTSPKKLADYLKMLDRNDDLYNSYFAWKKDYEIVSVSAPCELCEFLHSHKHKHSTLDRLDLFWNKYKDCTRPKVYYKGIANVDKFDFSRVY